MTVEKLTVPIETAVIIHQSIARIYHYAGNSSIERFKTQVMEQLAESIAFDGAYWLSFGCDAIPIDAQCAFLYHTTPDFVLGYHSLMIEQLVDKVAGVQSSTDHNRMISQLQLNNHLAISCHLRKFNIYHQLVLQMEYGGIQHLLCLFTKHQDHEFEQYEFDISAFLADNIARAFELCLRNNLQKIWRHHGGFRAICDLQGKILACGAEFEGAMAKRVPNWHPNVFVELLQETNLPSKLEFEQFKIQLTREDGFYQVELYQFDEHIETFTKAEFEVAKLLIKGIAVELVAEAKGVSRRTIDIHVGNIHDKMGMSKSTELISCLLHSNYNFDLDS